MIQAMASKDRILKDAAWYGLVALFAFVMWFLICWGNAAFIDELMDRDTVAILEPVRQLKELFR